VDYAMPEMTGTSVIKRAQACQPGIKALLITGHPEALRISGDNGSHQRPNG
jgi:CheY-like chemotaxis protein